jgi:HipA-like protein
MKIMMEAVSLTMPTTQKKYIYIFSTFFEGLLPEGNARGITTVVKIDKKIISLN